MKENCGILKGAEESPIHFYLNCTTVNLTIKWNNSSCSSTLINTSFPTTGHSIFKSRLKFRNQLKLLLYVRSQILFGIESSISIDSSNKDSLTRKIISDEKENSWFKNGAFNTTTLLASFYEACSYPELNQTVIFSEMKRCQAFD